jgi:hypothetical protein
MVYPHVEYLGPAYPDELRSDAVATTRELDSRTSHGIHVRLLWHPRDGHVSVAVNDDKTGDQFELRVRDGQRALDVFHHPYAHIAMRHDLCSAATAIAA